MAQVEAVYSLDRTAGGLRHDGTGYPVGPDWVRRDRVTSLLHVCDVYEALTAVRPYKPRMSPVRAYRIMMSMKNHFDPVLLRRFIAVNGVYPIGSQVKLTTGEVARVMKQNPDPMKPVIKVEVDETGAELSRDESLIRDLASGIGGPPAEIASLLDDAA